MLQLINLGMLGLGLGLSWVRVKLGYGNTKCIAGT